jgi:hypothetical protein
MSAFDSATKVKRAVADPVTDHKLPHPQSLSWAAITAPTAVFGTKGTHCEVVHGDQWNELKGNHTENIAQNQTIKVLGKHKETLVESCYQNIVGPHIVLNNNVRNETAMGTYTKTFGDWEQQDTNSGHFMYADFLLERTYFLGNMELIEVDLTGIGVYGQGAAASGVPIADIEWKTIHMEEHVVHHEQHAFPSDFHLFKAAVKGAEANAQGAKASLGPHVGAPPHGPLIGAA